MKINLVVRPDIMVIRFDEKSFFRTLLGLNPHWDLKHYNEYISRKIMYSSTIDRAHIKCDVVIGRTLNGLIGPIRLFSF